MRQEPLLHGSSVERQLAINVVLETPLHHAVAKDRLPRVSQELVLRILRVVDTRDLGAAKTGVSFRSGQCQGQPEILRGVKLADREECDGI